MQKKFVKVIVPACSIEEEGVVETEYKAFLNIEINRDIMIADSNLNQTKILVH